MFLLRRAGLVKVQGLLREGFSLPMGLDVSLVGCSLAQLTFTTLTCSCKGYVSFRATCDITGTSHRSTATNQCGPDMNESTRPCSCCAAQRADCRPCLTSRFSIAQDLQSWSWAQWTQVCLCDGSSWAGLARYIAQLRGWPELPASRRRDRLGHFVSADHAEEPSASEQVLCPAHRLCMPACCTQQRRNTLGRFISADQAEARLQVSRRLHFPI